jgi:hypothetical protein
VQLCVQDPFSSFIFYKYWIGDDFYFTYIYLFGGIPFFGGREKISLLSPGANKA